MICQFKLLNVSLLIRLILFYLADRCVEDPGTYPSHMEARPRNEFQPVVKKLFCQVGLQLVIEVLRTQWWGPQCYLETLGRASS